MINVTSRDFILDPFDLESPVECSKLKIIAVYCVFIFIGSLLSNTTLLWLLVYYRDLRNSVNAFMIALSSCNLVGSLIEMPSVIISNFNCKWYFKKAGCVFGGFVMYSVGCTSIFLITAISFERFYIIYKPMSIKALNFNSTVIIIALCVFFGVMWAIFPVFGWSHYSLEGALTSCSVEWHERSFNVVSYNITIFTFVYIIPLICITYSNLRLIFMIRNLPKFANKNNGTVDKQMMKKLRIEKEITISTLILIAGFLVSWTPYALVSMYAAFFRSEKMDPLAATIPSMFAKTSLVWSSVIYIYTNKQIKKKFKKFFFHVEEPQSVSMIKSETFFVKNVYK